MVENSPNAARNTAQPEFPEAVFMGDATYAACVEEVTALKRSTAIIEEQQGLGHTGPVPAELGWKLNVAQMVMVGRRAFLNDMWQATGQDPDKFHDLVGVRDLQGAAESETDPARRAELLDAFLDARDDYQEHWGAL
jgi:hypothetical protein